MLCCKLPRASKRDVDDLLSQCVRLFVAYRVYRGPESMDEYRAQIKWVMRAGVILNLTAGDNRDAFSDSLDDIGDLIIMRGLWLYVEPSLLMEMWAQFRLAVDVGSNWYSCYQPDIKGSIDSFMEWVDNNLRAIYESPPTDYNGWDYPKFGEDDNS